MAKRKADPEKRTRFRSIVPTVATEIVDHRLLIQLGLVLLVTVSLATWGPDGIRNGLNTIMASTPVRQAHRLTSMVLNVIVDGIRTVDQVTPEARRTAVADETAALSTKVAPTPDAVRSPDAPPAAASRYPSAVSGSSPVIPTSEPLILAGAAGDRPDADPADAILWLIEKDRETIRAEMHDRGKPGVDLLLFRNGQLWRRERWADRAGARNEARAKRAEFEKLGWSLSAQ